MPDLFLVRTISATMPESGPSGTGNSQLEETAMPGDPQEATELPDRPRGRHGAFDDDDDLESLDGPAPDGSLSPTGGAAGSGASAHRGHDDGPAGDTDPAELDPAELDPTELDEEEIDGEDEVDFAVVVYREAGTWHADPLPTAAVDTWAGFRATVGQRSSETGVIGVASLDESALVLLRLTGAGEQILLSDIETADYLAFSDDLVEYLRRTDPAVDELVESTEFGDAQEPVPVGQLGLLSDLGLSGDDLRELCEDLGGEPEDLLEEIGEALGIGRALGEAVDAAVAAGG